MFFILKVCYANTYGGGNCEGGVKKNKGAEDFFGTVRISMIIDAEALTRLTAAAQQSCM